MFKYQLKYYDAEFDVPCSVERTFDASPNDFLLGSIGDSKPVMWHEPGIEALQKLNHTLGPDAQFIVMVRDFIEVVDSKGGGPSRKHWHRKGKIPNQTDHVAWSAILCKQFANAMDNWLMVFPKESLFSWIPFIILQSLSRL